MARLHSASAGGGRPRGIRIPDAGGRRSALGALNLYRDRPSPLTPDQHADALVMADVAARWVLEAQDAAPPDSVPAELEDGADFHFAVHNAAGMISVQLGIAVAEALVRLRAYAFSNDRLLTDVAQDVIARTAPALMTADAFVGPWRSAFGELRWEQ